MTDGSTQTPQAELAQAREDGRRQGLAIAALAVAMISFVNLLSAEKSILAIVLAVLAMSGSALPQVRRRSAAAIGLAVLQMVTIVVILTVFHDRLAQLIELLRTLA